MARELYPEIEARDSFYLDVDDVHSIYVEESGNPAGIPVIFLHGGPGSGCNENHRRYFNPEKYRIIIFDQRGCNRSRPAGECRQNTTADLVNDVERIRERLDISAWVVFGGSWGATLALCYAETFPERVKAIILRGTFLARDTDLAWFVKSGLDTVFPDFWQEFLQPIPEHDRADLVSAYHSCMHGDDNNLREVAAIAWAKWAGRTVTWLLPDVDPWKYEPEDLTTTVNEVKIETHYAKNHYFLEPNQLIKHAEKLPDVPIEIIHGRKDLTCLVEASWTLHQAVPGSNLQIIRDAGHLAGEPLMTDALIRATDAMADRIGHG